MDKIVIRKQNEVYFRVQCDEGIAEELNQFFRFEVPGARYSPKFRMKVWDGTIGLFSKHTRLLYCGLYDHLVIFCKEREYELEVLDNPEFDAIGKIESISLEQVKTFVDALNIHSNGEKLEIRDYQYLAILTALKNKRRVILCPTASGKSLIVYCVMRFLLAFKLQSLVVVPTIALTYQMFNDFKDYSSANGWDASAFCQLIAEGKGTMVNFPVVVSTWQSIYKLPKDWFNQFGNVMIDEVHQAKADSLKGILEKCTHVKYRTGLTGSLDDSKTHKMMIQATLGVIERIATTKSLIDKGYLSQISITVLVLGYNSESKRLMRKVDYQQEIDFLCQHTKRNRYVANLATTLKGNTLVLYRFVEKHGDKLHELIKERAGDRKVFYIHGGVEGEDRDAIRAIVEKHNDAIILASVGTFSVGVNIKRLHNVVFASPTKSVIRVLQSIGRGLRLAKDKDRLNLYDVADSLSNAKKKNHTYQHLIERLKIYVKEEFTYRIVEVQIENDDNTTLE
jgi:superfamily II DNA or RNA helicase